MLADDEIVKAMNDGLIDIQPFDVSKLGPNSYDCHLANRVRFFRESHGIFNLKYSDDKTFEVKLPCMLQPKHTAVIMTKEIIGVAFPYAGIISPRSGLARLPIYFGYSQLVDTGYRGVLGMTLTNLSNWIIELEEDIRICQIMFVRVEGNVKRLYNERASSKYTKNDGSFVPHFQHDKEWTGPEQDFGDKDFAGED